jgi:nucleoside-diphosphate-sugar epimerase
MTERTSLSIFLTGGSTPLGLAVIKHLIAAGHQVAAHTSGADQSHVIREMGALPVYADLLRRGELKSIIALRKADVVINLATQAANHIPFYRANWQTSELYAMTEALYEAAAEAGAKFFVHTSFAFVYGDQHGESVDETTMPQPGDNELLRAALRAEKKALSGSIPACVLRLGYVYGAESNELRSLFETLRGARPVVSGKGYANWIHADDAAEAIRRAAEAQTAGGIYNIVDGTPATSETFLNSFAESIGLNTPETPPKFLNNFLLPQAQSDLMALSARARNRRAMEDLGWTPRFNSHREGIDDILLTWRAREVPATAIVTTE